MLKLKKIAITGGVASGKTSVCRFFQELGAFVVNTDAIVHELLVFGTDLGQKIIQQFGLEVLRNGQIDRQRIAERVFKNSDELKQLEQILHPAVLRKIEELYDKACHAGKFTLFVVEMPLLFEIHGEGFYDYVISVLANKDVARLRFETAGFLAADYDQRMKYQLSPEQKAKRAHYIIKNNGSLEDLKQQVAQLNNTIIHQR